MSQSYEDQVKQQIEQYRDVENMHDLPPVFHLWSSAYILPGLKEVFGANDINEFYVEAFITASQHDTNTPVFLSLGCGDGAVEIAIARTLRQRGLNQFRFVCYDLSEILLDRFRLAVPSDLSGHFDLVAGDLNAHIFEAKFNAVMANHSLHHIVDLEGIYRTTFDCLTDDGIFVTSDMIGRNGHMRWPEARLFVEFFWPFLSQRQRRNVLLRRQESTFTDFDCSKEGFEGIRAQDVLPLILRQGFHPWKFFGFGGMVDVFVDRCFGPGFDVADPNDAFLARRIGFLNEILLDADLVKPTMMLAYFTKTGRRDNVQFRNRSAAAAVRTTEASAPWLGAALSDFAHAQVDPDFVFRDQPINVPVPSILPHAPEPILATDNAQKLLDALRHAQEQQAAAQAQIVSLKERLRAMELSSSWELTAPLRLLLRKLRRSS